MINFLHFSISWYEAEQKKISVSCSSVMLTNTWCMDASLLLIPVKLRSKNLQQGGDTGSVLVWWSQLVWWIHRGCKHNFIFISWTNKLSKPSVLMWPLTQHLINDCELINVLNDLQLQWVKPHLTFLSEVWINSNHWLPINETIVLLWISTTVFFLIFATIRHYLFTFLCFGFLAGSVLIKVDTHMCIWGMTV